MQYTFNVTRSSAILDEKGRWSPSNFACMYVVSDAQSKLGAMVAAEAYAYDHRYGEPSGIWRCAIEGSLYGPAIKRLTHILPSGEEVKYGNYEVARYKAMLAGDRGFIAVETRDSDDPCLAGDVVIAGHGRQELLTLVRANELLTDRGPAITSIDSLVRHPSGFLFSGMRGGMRQSFLCQLLGGVDPIAVEPYYPGHNIWLVKIVQVKEGGRETLVLFARDENDDMACAALDGNYRLASDFHYVTGHGRFTFSDVMAYVGANEPTSAVVAFGTVDMEGSQVPHVFQLAWEKI